MANDLNNCSFIGRLGKDPEMAFMPDGRPVTKISIAVGKQWKNKAGDKQERTTWVPIVAFDRLAEIMNEYLKKGSQIYISGEFYTRKWQDQSGNDRYSTEIVAGHMQMLGGKSDGRSQPSGNQSESPTHTEHHAPAGDGVDFDDDIPF